MIPFFQRGTVSEQKKVENSTRPKRGTILVPLGALFFLIIMFMKQYPWGNGAPK